MLPTSRRRPGTVDPHPWLVPARTARRLEQPSPPEKLCDFRGSGQALLRISGRPRVPHARVEQRHARLPIDRIGVTWCILPGRRDGARDSGRDRVRPSAVRDDRAAGNGSGARACGLSAAYARTSRSPTGALSSWSFPMVRSVAFLNVLTCARVPRVGSCEEFPQLGVGPSAARRSRRRVALGPGTFNARWRRRMVALRLGTFSARGRRRRVAPACRSSPQPARTRPASKIAPSLIGSCYPERRRATVIA